MTKRMKIDTYRRRQHCNNNNNNSQICKAPYAKLQALKLQRLNVLFSIMFLVWVYHRFVVSPRTPFDHI